MIYSKAYQYSKYNTIRYDSRVYRGLKKEPTNVSDQSSNNILVYEIIFYSHRHVPVKCITCYFLTTFIITFCSSSLRTLCTVQVLHATVLTTDHRPPTQMVGLPIINNHAVVVRLSCVGVGRGREERN